MSGFVSLMAPVGPVSEQFIADPRVLCSIMGPFGSAKTTGCIRKIIESAGKQPPSPKDGVRRVRWCVVRDTYNQLETNVMKSWFSWFPKDTGDFNGREMRHTVKIDINRMDGGAPERWEIELLFRAMGDLKAEDVLKGLELTGLWLNEVDTLDRSVLTFGIGRVGRFPAQKDGGCTYRAVIADFNAPDIDNWTYELFVEQILPLDETAQESLRETLGEQFGIGFHRQPGGREPNAENKANLPKGYYEQMMIGMSEHHVRRFVDNEFGAVRNGQPVYPEYNDDFHCAKVPLDPLPGLPVSMAVDGGSTPAAVFGQRTDAGQIRTLDELVIFSPDDETGLEKMGSEAFGKACGEFWKERFGKCQFGGAWHDPAAHDGDDYQDSWATLFWRAFKEEIGRASQGWKFKPAPVRGNRLPERLETVRRGLVNSPGGKPGQLISPTCRVLRRGFNNGYVILRVAASHGSGRWSDKPHKNDFSHVHDAKQYLDLGLTKRGAMADGAAVRGNRPVREAPQRVNFGKGHFAHQARS